MQTPKNRNFWDDSKNFPPAFDCTRCKDKDICGGLNIPGGVMSCLDYCDCNDPKTCQWVCLNNPDFARRANEVGGWKFDRVPKPYTAPVVGIEEYVPHVYHGYRRDGILITKAVAVRLTDLFSFTTGQLRYASKEALAADLRVREDAQLIIVGVDDDPPIEKYWSVGRKARLFDQLKKLRPDLVSTPNYSVIDDVPRHDNLHALKRIVIAWQELAGAGLPASLHVNGRTAIDFERLGDFVISHQVRSVTFEFATGGIYHERADAYANHLCELGDRAGRKLHLLTRGGRAHLRRFRQHFARVSFVDTTPFSKMRNRNILEATTEDGFVWRQIRTRRGRPLDNILQTNVDLSKAEFEMERRGQVRPGDIDIKREDAV